ncbi:DNA (cytosine-5-)-methyltransferase [Bacteroidota bacterium]
MVWILLLKLKIVQKKLSFYSREREIKMVKIASLFSGCGGGDIGLKGDFIFFNSHYKKLPTKLVYANEYDPKIANIFEDNFNQKCDTRDIKEVDSTDIPDHDILVGGFPCVTFSIVAQNPKRLGYKDEKGQLYKEMARILRDKQPKAFIAENVRGILSANNHEAFPLILNEFRKTGYRIYSKLINAAQFGVPQKRQRVFIIGIRNDIEDQYSFPNPLFTNPKEYVPIRNFLEKEKSIDEKYYFSERALRGLYNSRPDLNKGRAQNIQNACNTLGSHLAKVSLNSTDPVLQLNGRFRRFTPKEVARLQSFPEDFLLTQPETHLYRALGNAIPPVLMWYVAKNLIKLLKKK